jgi:hypothetical protein
MINRKHTPKYFAAFFLLLIAGAVLMQMQQAEAVPAFARKYNMSCTTCHAPIPRLKAYGDEFAGNGFVLADQDAPRYFVPTGDDRLDLIRDFPIGVRFDGYMRHSTATGKEADLATPWILKLLSGGSITDNVAYYFYFYMNERGEVAGVEDAFLMFNNLLGIDLDVYIGQFQVSDPLFKGELRLTYEGYRLYQTKIGDSRASLGYDRGIMVTLGLETGTDIAFEIVNGNGLGEADEQRNYDDDKYKNVAGRISQDVNDYIRIGGFGYYGSESDTTGRNELYMIGGDASLSYMDYAELNLQYLFREDDNPGFTTPDTAIQTNGILAELIIMPHGDRSRWYGVAMYNQVDSDLDAHDYETITAHIGYMLRTNIRLQLENTYDIENEENTFVTGFSVGF